MLGLGVGVGLAVELGLDASVQLQEATPEVQSRVEGCLADINAELGASIETMKAVSYHAENEGEAGAEWTIKCTDEATGEVYKVVLAQLEAEASVSVKAATKLSAS